MLNQCSAIPGNIIIACYFLFQIEARDQINSGLIVKRLETAECQRQRELQQHEQLLRHEQFLRNLREQEIKELEDEIDQLEDEIDQREYERLKRKSQLDQQELELIERECQLDQRELELIERERQLDQCELELIERERQLDQPKLERLKKKRQLDQLELHLLERERQLAKQVCFINKSEVHTTAYNQQLKKLVIMIFARMLYDIRFEVEYFDQESSLFCFVYYST